MFIVTEYAALNQYMYDAVSTIAKKLNFGLRFVYFWLVMELFTNAISHSAFITWRRVCEWCMYMY